MASIKEALTQAKTQLAGISTSADLDAEVLIQHCLGKTLSWIISHGDQPLDEGHSQCFWDYIERRRQGEPVAYITEHKEFWSLGLKVNSAVLIPRPETEHLVEHALKHIPEAKRWRILDLGTGSGAVAIAIAKERPLTQVTATDISATILLVAGENADRLGINNVHFTLSNWFDTLSEQSFDLIVSNPPYIADNDPCMQKLELLCEPEKSLRAGPKGLDALSAIGAQARAHLNQNGWLLVEHGYDQQYQVASIFDANGFEDIICHLDHAGQPRVTECRVANRTT